MDGELCETLLEPVLEMELFVLSANGFYELTRLHGKNALLEDIEARCFKLSHEI